MKIPAFGRSFVVKKAMTQPVVFISYNQKDEREKDWLLSQLGVLQREGLISLWSDDQISAGANWEQEISEAITQARVAILLISANFLTSDFILGKEVPVLLQRRKSEGLTVFPVIAKDCAWQKVDWLVEMKVRPRNGRAIWGGGSRRVDKELAAIAEEVADIIKTTPEEVADIVKTTPSQKTLNLNMRLLFWKACFRNVWTRYWLLLIAIMVIALAAGIWWLLPNKYRPTPPTVEPTSVVSVGKVVIEIDGVVMDVNDDRCQEIEADSPARIEVKVLNSTGDPLQREIFSYNWRFNPSDPDHQDKLDTKNYVISYRVSDKYDTQTITLEVLRNGKTLNVSSICFDTNSSSNHN